MTVIERTTPPPLCAHDGCGNPAVTIDLYGGKRCGLHRPRFDGAVAVRLMRQRGVRVALAYVRTWAAMEATS